MTQYLITDYLKDRYKIPLSPDDDNNDEDRDTKMIYMKPSQTRILIKTILYRLLGIMITLSITYYFTGSYKKALGIGLIVEFAQTVVYYLYEQVWSVIEWGYISKTTIL